jgi:phosphomannomutase
MITGSHNPPEYNGFKSMSGDEMLHGEAIHEDWQTDELR